MSDKTQINSSVKEETITKIRELADSEQRSFSAMVDILLAEALKARTEVKVDIHIGALCGKSIIVSKKRDDEA